MTTPTNRRPDDDGLEERLAATFDRATQRAQSDLAGGRLAVLAIDRGRHMVRGGVVWRTGLLLAAVVLLGLGAVWLVGGLPAPSPSPLPSLALTSAGPRPSDGTPAPSSGSQEPVPEPSLGTQTPELPVGATFPPTVDGRPVFAVGGPAERHIAQTTDASVFYVSGWRLPLKSQGPCPSPGSASVAPDGVSFDPCATLALFAGPDGGASVSFLYSMTKPLLDWASLDPPQTRVRHVAVRVHTHDPDCTGASCALPVLDEVVFAAVPGINPTLLVESPPPSVAPVSLAISNGYDYAQEMINSSGGSGASPKGTTPVFMSAEFGTAAALGDANVTTEPLTTWEWKVVFASSDGLQVITVWEDARTGASDHVGSQSGGPYTGPP